MLNIQQVADKYQENFDNSKDYTIVYSKNGIIVNDFNFKATKEQEIELINNYKNSELKKYISFEVFVYNYVKENYNQNEIHENKIIINFANIVSELETKGLKLCFRKNKVGTFIIDSQNNMYQMEVYRQGSYLDQLIKDGITVEFNYVDSLLSKNIGEWEKEIWDVSEIENFMKRQKLFKQCI